MHCALHFRTSNRALVCAFASFTISLFSIPPNAALETFRGCLHRGGGPQIGEVTCGGSPHLSCKGHQIKMRDYMDRRVTPPWRVTSPTWGAPPPCKQALRLEVEISVVTA